MLAIQARLIGNRADDISRLNTMVVTDLNAKPLFVLVRLRFAAPALAFVIRSIRVAHRASWFVFIRCHQQVAVTNRELCQCAGNFERRDIVFLLVLLNHVLHECELARRKRVSNFLLEVRDALVVYRFR